MSSCIGGVILYDETLNRKHLKKNKNSRVNCLKWGVLQVLKLILVQKVLLDQPDEKITEGLRWFKRKTKRIL